ncbi:hypothetical protein U27_05236 [Candidatus Vecturithrix granuli]|uniref:Uncharacterized protein n=1 Tax=Vecturithrix granuli TaxID=1499967 RepID=A0A081C108_VECG1|nr:hypothetical protein U27_05236 [Candidatus Vecturithrix granuli]
MTAQEKLNKIEEIVQEYIQDNTLLAPSVRETAGQKNIREDMQAIISVISREDVESDMTVADIKAKLREIWEKAKPENW